MGVGGFISALVVGLIVGALGRLAVPGKQNIPIWLTMLIGVVAAMIGLAIAEPMNIGVGEPFNFIRLIIQVALAAVGVVAVVALKGRSKVH